MFFYLFPTKYDECLTRPPTAAIQSFDPQHARQASPPKRPRQRRHRVSARRLLRRHISLRVGSSAPAGRGAGRQTHGEPRGQQHAATQCPIDPTTCAASRGRRLACRPLARSRASAGTSLTDCGLHLPRTSTPRQCSEPRLEEMTSW